MPEVAEPEREPTVADLAERYFQTHVAVQCKASSMSRYRQLLQHHILPSLGEMPVGSVERKHVAAIRLQKGRLGEGIGGRTRLSAQGDETRGNRPC